MEGVVSPRSSKRLRPEPEGEAKPHAAQKFPGTTFTYGVGNADDAVVDAAKVGLRELCSTAGVDESHGVGHALKASGVPGGFVTLNQTSPCRVAQSTSRPLSHHRSSSKRYLPPPPALHARSRPR